MKKLEVKDLKENFSRSDWKRVGSWLQPLTKEKFNTMTASWGASAGCGINRLLSFLSVPNGIHTSL